MAKQNEKWEILDRLPKPSTRRPPVTMGTIEEKIWRRWRTRYAVLKEGILKLYKKKTEVRDGKEERRLDMRNALIVKHQSTSRQIVIDMGRGSVCELRIRHKEDLLVWLEQLKSNRAFEEEQQEAFDQKDVKGKIRNLRLKVQNLEEKLHLWSLSAEKEKETKRLFQFFRKTSNHSKQFADQILPQMKRILEGCSMLLTEFQQKEELHARATTRVERRQAMEPLRKAVSAPQLPVDAAEEEESESSSVLVSKESSSDLSLYGEEESEFEEQSPEEQRKVVAPAPPKHRQSLPCPMPPNQSFSLLSFLRSGTISIPIHLCEPLNWLQGLCEELEFSHLLDQAMASDDERLRLGLVSCFAISRYAGKEWRMRKPLNPLLGETYEFVESMGERGWRFHSEKVSHHPHVCACEAEGKKGWFFAQNVGMEVRPHWNTLDVVPGGRIELHLPISGKDEIYRWSKVMTTVYNLQSPEKRSCNHHGVMTIACSNGLECRLEFEKGENKYGVEGTMKKNDKGLIGRVQGNLKSCVSLIVNGKKSDLFLPPPLTPQAALYYGFGQFALELNELREECRKDLAPTDSRFRPDMRLLEEGRVEDAQKAKNKMEELQRTRIKAAKSQYVPLWFWKNSADFWVCKKTFWTAKQRKFPLVKFPDLWPSDVLT